VGMKIMKTDIQIAQKAKLKPIQAVAKKLNINQKHLELYGQYKAKFLDSLEKEIKNKKDGKLILVTAITPTPAGEGKTTTMIGLGQAFWKLKQKTIIAMREPSLGPVFGMKGGAAGGGRAQVVPMEDINLHFTGDMHAVTTANNLLSALLDNHLHHGNKLKINPDKITWKRVLDMNDRSLRQIKIGLGPKTNGIVRDDGFVITVASEIMAILCLSKNLSDLKSRLGKIIVGYNAKNKPVTARDLKADGAMAAVLKDAIRPNLIQTLEGTPVLMHGGPFANIAHGCNSIRATKLGLKLADFCLTEAGFGADLGAEKFFNIKCWLAKLKPSAVVLVATARAVNYHGLANLEKHIVNLKKFNLPVVVALNHFSKDKKKEIDLIKNKCQELGAEFAISKVWEKGGSGGVELAKKVLKATSQPSRFKTLYNTNSPIENKIKKIAVEIYGADGVNYSVQAKKEIKRLEKLKMYKLPICIAKTQYSFSDDPKREGVPKNFKINIREIKISAGAGFIVAIAGKIMTMPGLPKKPAAEKIDISSYGKITGIF